MKKYITLSTLEAFRYFIDHDQTLIPEAVSEIRRKNHDEFHGEACVTIVIPTHRTHPDSEKDPIDLKNSIAEAEKALHEMLEKRQVWPIVENMQEAEATIDHRHNLDSLVLYANEHFSAVVKLPVELETRVAVGREFDLRPLYKARQQNRSYYILTVSKQLIRLVEAHNDKALYEREDGDFPFGVNRFYEVRPDKRQAASFVENMEKEFYNDADKSFRKYWNENPLPMVLAGDVKSVSYYEEVMDNRCPVIGRMAGNQDQTPLHGLVEAAWPEVEKYRQSQQDEYLQEIDRAASANLLTTDLSEMFGTAEQGSAAALFLAWNYSLDGKISWKDLEKYNNDEQQTELTPSDLLNILIADIARNGGRVIFMENGNLDKYDGILLEKRF